MRRRPFSPRPLKPQRYVQNNDPHRSQRSKLLDLERAIDLIPGIDRHRIRAFYDSFAAERNAQRQIRDDAVEEELMRTLSRLSDSESMPNNRQAHQGSQPTDQQRAGPSQAVIDVWDRLVTILSVSRSWGTELVAHYQLVRKPVEFCIALCSFASRIRRWPDAVQFLNSCIYRRAKATDNTYERVQDTAFPIVLEDLQLLKNDNLPPILTISAVEGFGFDKYGLLVRQRWATAGEERASALLAQSEAGVGPVEPDSVTPVAATAKNKRKKTSKRASGKRPTDSNSVAETSASAQAHTASPSAAFSQAAASASSAAGAVAATLSQSQWTAFSNSSFSEYDIWEWPNQNNLAAPLTTPPTSQSSEISRNAGGYVGSHPQTSQHSNTDSVTGAAAAPNLPNSWRAVHTPPNLHQALSPQSSQIPSSSAHNTARTLPLSPISPATDKRPPTNAASPSSLQPATLDWTKRRRIDTETVTAANPESSSLPTRSSNVGAESVLEDAYVASFSQAMSRNSMSLEEFALKIQSVLRRCAEQQFDERGFMEVGWAPIDPRAAQARRLQQEAPRTNPTPLPSLASVVEAAKKAAEADAYSMLALQNHGSQAEDDRFEPSEQFPPANSLHLYSIAPPAPTLLRNEVLHHRQLPTTVPTPTSLPGDPRSHVLTRGPDPNFPLPRRSN